MRLITYQTSQTYRCSPLRVVGDVSERYFNAGQDLLNPVRLGVFSRQIHLGNLLGREPSTLSGRVGLVLYVSEIVNRTVRNEVSRSKRRLIRLFVKVVRGL